MFLIYGRRTTRVKKYPDQSQYCPNCKSFDLIVRVYKEYFHVFYIPFFPTGITTSKIHCNTCGQPFRNDTMQKRYEDISKKPIYLYSGLLLIGGLIALMINLNVETQKEKARLVANPKVGDVYLIRTDENNSTSYYFLRVSQINGDTLYAYHNNLMYSGFITELNNEDFFVRDEELIFTQEDLKTMLDKNEINSVERDYGDYSSFNRIK